MTTTTDRLRHYQQQRAAYQQAANVCQCDHEREQLADRAAALDGPIDKALRRLWKAKQRGGGR